MSQAATDWLSLDRAKLELRVAAGNDDHDDLIVGHIEAAVDHVERETGLPLIDRTDTLRVCASGKDPMELGWLVAAKEAKAVRYWSGPEVQRLPPDEEVPVASLGALRAKRPAAGWAKETFLYPPAAGWPKVVEEMFEVEVVRGLHPALHPSLSQAVALLTRDFYEGFEMAKRPSAVGRLLHPYKGDRP